MNIKYLEEFLTLADTLNYSEAADKLYISQSTLSKHIIAIENELEFHLFDRDTRHISLSESGKAFYGYAKTIVNTYRNGTESIKKDLVDHS